MPSSDADLRLPNANNLMYLDVAQQTQIVVVSASILSVHLLKKTKIEWNINRIYEIKVLKCEF